MTITILCVIIWINAILMMNGKHPLQLISNRIEAKAIGSADIADAPVALDEKGISKELNYHHIRAREIEMGIEVDQLTSCESEDCIVCDSPYTERAVKELAGTGEPVTFDSLSHQLEEIDRKIKYEVELKRRAEREKREAKERERKRQEYEKQFLVDYPASNYRPSHVPAHAAVEGVNIDAGVRLTWKWDENTYHKIVPKMVMHYKHNPDYTDGSEVPEFTGEWTLRKRRPVDKKDDRDIVYDPDTGKMLGSISDLKGRYKSDHEMKYGFR